MMTTNNWRSNLGRGDVWMRILYMLLFVVVYSVVEVIVIAATVFQLGFVLVSGDRNARLQNFNESLSRYVYDVLRFIMFVSDSKPFPFTDWHSGHHGSHGARL